MSRKCLARLLEAAWRKGSDVGESGRTGRRPLRRRDQLRWIAIARRSSLRFAAKAGGCMVWFISSRHQVSAATNA